MDYNNGIDSIDNQFSLVESSYIATLNDSLWVYDNKQIQLQLEGILNLEDIVYADILINGNSEYQAGMHQVKNKIVKTYKLKHHFNNKEVLLGALTLYADLDNLYAFLKKKVIIILFSQAIKTFFISFFILFLFQRFVTRHLETIARFLNELSLNHSEKSLNLHKEYSNDELDQVTTAINTMQKSLSTSYNALSHELHVNTQMKDEILKSQEGLIQAQSIAKVGNWEWNIKEERLYGSLEFFKILDIDTKQTYLDKDDMINISSDNLDFPLLSMLINNTYSELQLNDIMYLTLNNHERKYIKSRMTIYYDIQQKAELIVGTIQDITSEHLITLENNNLLFAMNESPILIFITDAQGNIEYINESVYKLFPTKSQDIIGKDLTVLLSDADTNIFPEAFKTSKESTVWEGEISESDTPEQVFTMKTIISPIKDSQNNTIKYTLWQEDITLEKELNHKLLLQSKHAQMGEMIAMIAHQWRQPLANVNTLMSNLRIKSELDSLTKETVADLSDKISKQTAHLSQTIQDFSNFFKPNKDKVKISFNELIEKAHTILGSLFKMNIINVNNTVPDNIIIDTYSNELLQVILNLLKNSVDAFSGSSEEKKFINISLEEDTEFTSFSFTDNAGGIDKDIIDDIFSPYFSTKTEKNGTGLGLYMSKTIIENHMDGKLNVTSSEGHTSFRLSFPNVLMHHS